MKTAIFTKVDKPTVKEAVEYLRKKFKNISVFQGRRGESLPKGIFEEQFDILISYLSPWIIPVAILNKTRSYNINFHPGPPEYPGTGCFNFAIYNEEKLYGVMAHLMDEKVDTGKIIVVKRFPLLESDSVFTLSLKSYKEMLSLFYEVIDFILEKKKLHFCGESWKRPPYTRKELEDLCKVDTSMPKKEIEKRIKATLYPDMPSAYIDIFGRHFEYNPKR